MQTVVICMHNVCNHENAYKWCNIGTFVCIHMFVNCMQTIEYILMYVICLHSYANCMYTVCMRRHTNYSMYTVCMSSYSSPIQTILLYIIIHVAFIYRKYASTHGQELREEAINVIVNSSCSLARRSIKNKAN